MKRFYKILEGLKYESPLPVLLENGYTPVSIKTEIIETFKPFFRNYNNLERFAIDYLVSDWINFLRLTISYPEIVNDIVVVLKAYNQAKDKDYKTTFDVLARMIPLHLEAGNKYWSFLKLEVNKKDLDIYEFAQTSMKDVSDIIEGLSKSVYIENALINKIIRGKSLDIEKMLNNKLGNIINDLVANSEYSSIFIVPSENLTISNWRNIAAHHTYSVIDNLIHCESGVDDNKTVFSLERDELLKRVNYCMRTTEILYMAHKIFGFDNLPEISLRLHKDNRHPRPEIGFLIFSSALMSQGFEILNIDYNQERAILDLYDLTKNNPRDRGIHSSQLLNRLWLLTNSKYLEIRYFTNEKDLFLTSSINSEIFEQMENEDKKDIRYFAENVTFKLENSG